MRTEIASFWKKIACVLLAYLLAAFCPIGVDASPRWNAWAEGEEWGRVIKDNVKIYANAESSAPLFVLKKTYYVKIVGGSENHYAVCLMGEAEFPQIVGYVRKNDLKICSEPISPTYPTVKLTVQGSGATIRLSPTPNAEIVLMALNTQKVSYYGSVQSYDASWHYVYYCGKFGYVLAEELTEPKIGEHPTPLEVPTVAPVLPSVPSGEEQEKDEHEGSGVNPTAELTMIAFVVLLAVTLTCAAFLPFNKKEDKTKIYDEDM